MTVSFQFEPLVVFLSLWHYTLGEQGLDTPGSYGFTTGGLAASCAVYLVMMSLAIGTAIPGVRERWLVVVVVVCCLLLLF